MKIELKDPKVRAVFDAAESLATRSCPVLILGEPGSGRGVLARRIQQMSRRASDPWRAVDCSTSGDLRSIETAPPGTLFLRNVDRLRRDLQAPLGTLLGSQGGTSRILASGSPDLPTQAGDGRFSLDLYRELGHAELWVPPLRERPTDIPQLVAGFLARTGWDGDAATDFADEAMEYLLGYDWPGNVAELEHTIDRLGRPNGHGRLKVDDLPPQIRWFPGNQYAGALWPPQEGAEFNPLSEEFQIRLIADAMRRTRHV